MKHFEGVSFSWLCEFESVNELLVDSFMDKPLEQMMI